MNSMLFFGIYKLDLFVVFITFPLLTVFAGSTDNLPHLSHLAGQVCFVFNIETKLVNFSNFNLVEKLPLF